jgi:hypothetical protein
MVSKTNLGGSLAIIPYLVNRYFSGTKIVTGVAFDGAAEIPAGRFERSSISLAPNTMIQETDQSLRVARQYIVGQEPVEVEEKMKLDILAERLGTVGFGSKNRQSER